MFGHHHPWYLGGLRAMVHAGATVLSMPIDTSYLSQLVSFKHEIHPDSLEMEPRPLKLQTLDSINTFSDGNFSMQVYHIGEPSKHTDDYLIYYFPKEKLLFEDDLSGLDTSKPLRAANEREKGLYDGIKKYQLSPTTIAQSWPVKKPGDVIFPYSLLEASVKLMK